MEEFIHQDEIEIEALSQKSLLDFASNGGDINKRDAKGFTVLHRLCEEGNLELVEFVFQKLRAEPSLKDRGGLTSLHWAAMRGHTEVVQYLVESVEGVDTFTLDNSGHSPLQLALANYKVATAQYLIRHMVAREISIFKTDIRSLSSLDLARALVKDGCQHMPELSLENVNLLPAKSFIRGGRIASHEDLRGRGALVSAAALSARDRVLFVAHQWEGRREPDPGKNQFKMVRKFLQDWARDNPDEPIDYIWIDYSCLTQIKHANNRINADYRFQLPNIMTAMYLATHCLVVPRITTVSDNPCTDLKGLFVRGWCQVEIAIATLTGTKMHCCYWYGRSQNPNCVQQIVPIDFYSSYRSPSVDVPLYGFKAASMAIMDSHRNSEALRTAVTEVWTVFQEPAVNYKAITSALVGLRKTDISRFEDLCSMSLRYDFIKSHLPLHEIYWDLGEFRVADDRVIAFNAMMLSFLHLSGMMVGIEVVKRAAPSCHCLGAESAIENCNVM